MTLGVKTGEPYAPEDAQDSSSYLVSALQEDELPFHILYSAAMMPEIDENELFDLLYEEHVERTANSTGVHDIHHGEDFDTAYDSRFKVNYSHSKLRVPQNELEDLTRRWAFRLDGGSAVRSPSLPHGPKINWLFPKRVGYGLADVSQKDKDELSVKRNEANWRSVTGKMAFGTTGIGYGTKVKYNIQSSTLDKILTAGAALSVGYTRLNDGRMQRYKDELTKVALADFNDEFGEYSVRGDSSMSTEEESSWLEELQADLEAKHAQQN